MRYIFFLISVTIICCKDTYVKPEDNTINPSLEKNIIVPEEMHKDTIAQISSFGEFRKMKILVVPCSNGYEFLSAGYDFNSKIEKELRKIPNMEVIPFSHKKLMGVRYQGVYDKRYCKPILEKVNADYFIMTRFTGQHPDTPELDSIEWGYETKIFNTKSMNQKISIGKDGLKVYKDIETDIVVNLYKMVYDIENLK